MNEETNWTYRELFDEVQKENQELKRRLAESADREQSLMLQLGERDKRLAEANALCIKLAHQKGGQVDEMRSLKARLTEAEKFHHTLPERCSEEFLAFVSGMAEEYNRHRAEQGDSWRETSPYYIFQLLDGAHARNWEELKKNPSHLLDIANFCWFLYSRLMALRGEAEG